MKVQFNSINYPIKYNKSFKGAKTSTDANNPNRFEVKHPQFAVGPNKI